MSISLTNQTTDIVLCFQSNSAYINIINLSLSCCITNETTNKFLSFSSIQLTLHTFENQILDSTTSELVEQTGTDLLIVQVRDDEQLLTSLSISIDELLVIAASVVSEIPAYLKLAMSMSLQICRFA